MGTDEISLVIAELDKMLDNLESELDIVGLTTEDLLDIIRIRIRQVVGDIDI